MEDRAVKTKCQVEEWIDTPSKLLANCYPASFSSKVSRIPCQMDFPGHSFFFFFFWTQFSFHQSFACDSYNTLYQVPIPWIGILLQTLKHVFYTTCLRKCIFKFASGIIPISPELILNTNFLCLFSPSKNCWEIYVRRKHSSSSLSPAPNFYLSMITIELLTSRSSCLIVEI